MRSCCFLKGGFSGTVLLNRRKAAHPTSVQAERCFWEIAGFSAAVKHLLVPVLKDDKC